MSTHSKLIARIDRQTDRQTHRHTDTPTTLPLRHTREVKIYAIQAFYNIRSIEQFGKLDKFRKIR